MTITPQLILLLALLALSLVMVIIYLIRLYNDLIFMRNNAEKAFSNIDVLLQQRFQEIPNQLALVTGTTEHEKELLRCLSQQREQNNSDSSQVWQQHLHQLNMIFSGLDRAAMHVEDYPRLTSNDVFIHYQKRIAELEEVIAESRQFYNQCCTLFNDKLLLIPNRYLMQPLGMKSLALLNKRTLTIH